MLRDDGRRIAQVQGRGREAELHVDHRAATMAQLAHRQAEQPLGRSERLGRSCNVIDRHRLDDRQRDAVEARQNGRDRRHYITARGSGARTCSLAVELEELRRAIRVV